MSRWFFLWIVELNKVCTFFGHRNAPSYLYASIKQQAETLIKTAGVNHFWVGGYGNFDMMAACSIRELKRTYPHIHLYLILAYLPQQSKSELNYLYNLYDDLIYPEGMELFPQRLSILKRNAWMAENCDYAICYVCAAHGGAYQAMYIAKQKQKNVINLIQ
ncbi:MAG: DUF1273 domain-containing protein [Alphaproteobacteria bacterium]|nr:DUF1273 domain-containing protein [Alphaproteobacteria bacterium]